MAIKLGLERMQSLYAKQQPKWKSIHVAGTNGKGSICSYISFLLNRKHISHGRFTSPFIRRPEDSIVINNKPIPTDLFRHLYETAGDRTKEDIATHFERMTYAAFKAFDHFGVQYGVVETGLGGRLDATNVLQNKAVTVISKIGLDHQEYLGDTIEEITADKAEIMRRKVPCIINAHNPPEATRVLLEVAEKINAVPILATAGTDPELIGPQGLKPASGSQPWPEHMVDNALCALLACRQLPEFKGSGPIIKHLDELPRSPMEGRLQPQNISSMYSAKAAGGRTDPILLDGAHNIDAWTALTTHASQHLRTRTNNIIWVIAISKPRRDQVPDFISRLPPCDTVICTEYEHFKTPKDNPGFETLSIAFRPQPVDRSTLRDDLASLPGEKPSILDSPDLIDALRQACELAKGNNSTRAEDSPIIVTGSLYLVADVLKWVSTGACAWPPLYQPPKAIRDKKATQTQ